MNKGAIIRAKRKKLGITQETLCILTGVDRGNLSKFENGIPYHMGEESVSKLLEVLDKYTTLENVELLIAKRKKSILEAKVRALELEIKELEKENKN